jgi:hypothetical protein
MLIQCRAFPLRDPAAGMRNLLGERSPAMTAKPIDRTASAYPFPLLIRHLLNPPRLYAPKQPKKDWRGKLDESALKDYFKQAAEKGIIPRHGVPDRVVFVDAIAKTSVGKINKKELRHQFGPPQAARKESP